MALLLYSEVFFIELLDLIMMKKDRDIFTMIKVNKKTPNSRNNT